MEVGLSPGDFVLDGDPAPRSPKRGQSPLPNFRLMFIVAKRLDGSRWHLARRCHIVLDGDQLPSPKKGAEPPPPIFGFLLSPNGWMNQDGTWHGGGPWSKPHCARWGPSSPPQKMGQSPQIFGPYCRQTAGCIRMPLGMDVGLSPGDFVLDGDPVVICDMFDRV